MENELEPESKQSDAGTSGGQASSISCLEAEIIAARQELNTSRLQTLKSIKAAVAIKQRWQLMFENIYNGVAVYKAVDEGQDFVFVDFNPAAEAIDKIKKRDVEGKRITEVFPGIRDMGLLECLRRVWNSGEPECFPVKEYKDSRLSGWRENYVFRLPNGEVVAIYSDETENRRNSQELELFRDLMDHSNDTIFVLEPDTGRILNVNKTASANLGYSRQELLNMSMLDFSEMIPGFSWQGHFEFARHNGSLELSAEYVRKNSTTFPVDINISYVQHGSNAYLVAIARDISKSKAIERALRKSEKRYRNFLETANMGVLIIDENEHITYANPWIINLLGYSREELVSTSIFSLVKPEFKDEGLQKIQQRKRGIAGESEIILLTKAGSEIVLHIKSNPIMEDNTYNGCFMFANDVTAQRHAEKLEKDLTQRLEHSQRLEVVGQLAGGVAHDFNNILGSIMGFADLLESRVKKDKKLHTYASQILNSCERGASLVGQLLVFSRQKECRMESVNIHEVLERIGRILHSTFDKRIKISQSLKARSCIVRGDVALLENALINIALNARDAMPEGGAFCINTEDVQVEGNVIDIAAVGALNPGSYLQIKLTDTGSGMTPEVVKKIFRPFFTTKAVGAGTGLGLSNAHGCIIQHQGCIQVESQPGQGTAFIIFLPIAVSVDIIEQTPTLKKQSGGGRHVLIVDDEDVIRVMARDMLEEQGFKVSSSCDGQEGLEFYREHYKDIDVVLLDMNMPRLNGYDCFAAMRKLNAGARVIAFTGFTAEEHILKMRAGGLHDYIGKPFRSDLLISKINEVLSRPAVGGL